MEQSVFGLHKLKSIGIRLAAGRSATMMRFFAIVTEALQHLHASENKLLVLMQLIGLFQLLDSESYKYLNY